MLSDYCRRVSRAGDRGDDGGPHRFENTFSVIAVRPVARKSLPGKWPDVRWRAFMGERYE
jgi:hypothetical protein